MKLIINKSQLNMAPEQWLRQAGYAYYRDRRTGKDSFSRRLGSGFFPKLHMYVEEQNEKIIFNLHLDQKQASYAGARMHNAEHDGEVVAEEIARLRSLLSSPIASARLSSGIDPIDKIGHGEYDKTAKPELKKSWWRKIFG
jgi:predicted Zn-dependent peptidase